MKLVTYLLFFFCAVTSSFCQVELDKEYLPSPFTLVESSSSSYLSMLNSDQGWIAVSSFAFEPAFGYQYTYAIDSILGMGNYYRGRVQSANEDGSDSFIVDYYREEGGKLYKMSDDGFGDLLILDMNLVEGDSIIFDQLDTPTILVATAVDTITYNDGVPRKRIELNCTYGSGDFGNWYWVEGLGELNSGTYCTFDGSSGYINCVLDQEGENIYKSSYSNAPCWLTTSLDEKNILSIDLFPNPTERILQLSGINGLVEYSIYNFMGITVMHGEVNDGAVDVSSLLPGSYIIQIGDGRILQQRKFVKI